MYIVAILVVLCSGFLHAVWNLFTKRSQNKIVFLWHIHWVSFLIFLPFALPDYLSGDRPVQAYILIALSTLIHGLYIILLAKTYTLGDLSQVYPIMRGASPLLVPLISVLFLDENLSLMGWAGVGLIVAGIFMLSGFSREEGDREKAKGAKVSSKKAVLLALSVGCCIASYIIVDKLSLQYFSPVGLNEVSNLGNLAALSWVALRSGELKQEWKINKKTILLGSVIAPGGYMLFLFALSLAPVSHLAPMREIGTVFGTVLGIFVLNEAQGKSRIAASALITSGVIMLGAA